MLARASASARRLAPRPRLLGWAAAAPREAAGGGGGLRRRRAGRVRPQVCRGYLGQYPGALDREPLVKNILRVDKLPLERLSYAFNVLYKGGPEHCLHSNNLVVQKDEDILHSPDNKRP